MGDEEWKDEKQNTRKFSKEEDRKLKRLVSAHGCNAWKKIALLMPSRSPRQCRERWNYYLNPKTSNTNWTAMEDTLLMEKFMEIGTQWSLMAKFFPSKNSVNLKNRYHKLTRQRSKIPIKPSDTTDEIHTGSENCDDGMYARVIIIEFPIPISLLPISIGKMVIESKQ